MHHEFTPQQIHLLLSKIDTTAGPTACWPYNGFRNKAGYGVCNVGAGKNGRKLVLAHRFIFIISNGELTDEDQFVLHSCDNPPCCNPAHLRAGTKADNSMDMILRSRTGDHRGEANGAAKLNDDLVRQIRKEWMPVHGIYEQLARKYGISGAMVNQIVKRKAWKHID